MKRYITIVLLLFLASFSHAQNCNTQPPTGNIRSLAEWEKQQSVLLAWDKFDFDNNVLQSQIVEALQSETTVIIFSEDINETKNFLTSQGVDWSLNVEFKQIPYNTLWIRDYGPNTVYVNNGNELNLIDWKYNRNRIKDDTSPTLIAQDLGIPIHCTLEDNLLVNTGGNFMADSWGKAFASDLIIEENDIQINEINSLLDQFMGIESFITMPSLPYDEIHHIDMHMKLLDESTLLVGEYPQGIKDGPQIEANIQYILSNYTTPKGLPYRIVRVPMPPNQESGYINYQSNWTYANALISNSKILVPTYLEKYDTTALRIWSENMPGYEVIGLDCTSIINSYGAIHCITKEIGAATPFWVGHDRVRDFEEDDCIRDFSVNAQHPTGVENVKLYVKTNVANNYSEYNLNKSIADSTLFELNNQFTVVNDPTSEFFQYYFVATSFDGSTMRKPLPENGYFTFKTTCTEVDAKEVSTFVEQKSVFPNPASAVTCLPIECKKSQSAKILLIDALGRVVHTIFDGIMPFGESKYFFDASQFSAGIYSVEVISNDYKPSVQKLVIH